MENYDVVEPEEGVANTQIWTANIYASEEHDGYPAIYVLTKSRFHYLVFDSEQDRIDAVNSFSQGDDDPEELTASKTVSISLKDVQRIDWLPGKRYLNIQYDHDERPRWITIHCPEDLARTLFRSLRERLRGRLRLGQERQSMLGALGTPVGVFAVVWFFVMLV